MKKILAILMAASLMFSLTACTDRNENNSSSQEPGSSSSDPVSSLPEDPVIPEPEPIPEDDVRPLATPTMSADFGTIEILESKGVTWGWGPHVDDDNRSIGCQNLQEQYGQYNAFFIAPNTMDFYLTFDEGYENGYTAPILDALKEKNAPAIFFVTMHYAKTNPDLIQRMIDEGHMVGNHSCNHPNFTHITPEEAFEEIKGLHDYMLEEYDYTMTAFRYPEGEFNEQTLALLDQMGYRTAFWSFAYADWDPDSQMSYDDALNRVKNAAHPGAIYLLHAVSSTNAEILPEFIDWLRDEGYKLRSFDIDKSNI